MGARADARTDACNMDRTSSIAVIRSLRSVIDDRVTLSSTPNTTSTVNVSSNSIAFAPKWRRGGANAP
jgi:hypothetical protein